MELRNQVVDGEVDDDRPKDKRNPYLHPDNKLKN